MKGFIIDCDYIIRVKEYMSEYFSYPILRRPSPKIIFIDTGLWENW